MGLETRRTETARLIIFENPIPGGVYLVIMNGLTAGAVQKKASRRRTHL